MVYALVDHWHEMCPNFTIQGTNKAITVTYVDCEKRYKKILITFDGCFVHVNYRGTGNLFAPFPKKVDLNREKELETLEDALKELNDRSDPVA